MPDKPTWIAIAGTYRTGSTTLYEMTRDVVETTKQGYGTGYHTESRMKDFDNIEKGRYVVTKVFQPFFDPEVIEPRTKGPSRMVKFLEEERLKAIVSIRHPLDIITSMKKRNEGRGEKGGKDKWDFEVTAKER